MWNTDYKEQYIRVCDKLDAFKKEVYESEVIQDFKRELNNALRERDVAIAKYESMYNCNQTLTQALNNLTQK